MRTDQIKSLANGGKWLLFLMNKIHLYAKRTQVRLNGIQTRNDQKESRIRPITLIRACQGEPQPPRCKPATPRARQITTVPMPTNRITNPQPGGHRSYRPATPTRASRETKGSAIDVRSAVSSGAHLACGRRLSRRCGTARTWS